LAGWPSGRKEEDVTPNPPPRKAGKGAAKKTSQTTEYWAKRKKNYAKKLGTEACLFAISTGRRGETYEYFTFRACQQNSADRRDVKMRGMNNEASPVYVRIAGI